jgi:HEAT repeat protein
MTPGTRIFANPLRWTLALLLTGWAAGCTGVKPAHPDIQSDDADRRILAIKAAAQSHNRAEVPQLVDRLEDEDEAVRFFAILALEKITGQRFGYDYGQSSQARGPSVERWRVYVRRKEYMIAADPQPAPKAGEKQQTADSGT